MTNIENITYIIWKLLHEDFKVVDYDEKIKADIGAKFEIYIKLHHEYLGVIEYNFNTLFITNQFREITSCKL